MKEIKMRINCTCTKTNCPVYEKCSFLPTELDLKDTDKLDILFVGQGGGRYERKEKRPFVGPAGNRIKDIVNSIRNSVKGPIGVAYSNVIRDCPKDNRVPTEEELFFCLPYLYQDIKALKDQYNLKLVIPLGRAALKATVIYATGAMDYEHGRIYNIENDIYGKMCFIGTYHPSFLHRKKSSFNIHKLGIFDVIVIKDIIKGLKYIRNV